MQIITNIIYLQIYTIIICIFILFFLFVLGVPIVLCGAKLVEKQIMEDTGMIKGKDVKTTVLFQYVVFVMAIFLFIHFLMTLI